MITRIPVVLATLVSTLTLAAPLTAQCVPNELCPQSSISGQVDFVTAATFDGAAPGGDLVVSGIPAGAVILSARFYCESSAGTTVTGGGFDGNPLILTQIGHGFGTTGAKTGRSYAANVTSLVPGNGTYPYVVNGGVNSGAGLVVVYSDCNIAGTYQIELHEGYNPGVFVDLSDGAWPNTTLFSGFTVDGTATPDAEVSFFVMNAAPGLNEEYFFQGVSLDCCDPANNLFEFERYDVSSFLSGGETSVSLDITELGGAISLTVGLFRVRTSAPGGPTCAVNYCTAGTSASGCQAILSSSGTASATATSGFNLIASGVEGLKDGLYFFNSNGRQANSWGSGTSFQCVVPPVFRGGLLVGGGTTGQCDGSFSQDLNALWCATCPKPPKNPGAGALVQAQLWYRDPMNTSNQTTSLSDAHEFSVGP